MCGIVAAVSRSNIVPFLIEGLKKLEYRGYDSADIAVIGQSNIERVRSVGRVAELETGSSGHAALVNGKDMDKPRNLAKSVTVE